MKRSTPGLARDYRAMVAFYGSDKLSMLHHRYWLAARRRAVATRRAAWL